MHAAAELLRHLTQRLKLVQKLRQQLATEPALLDLAKAAKLLTDVNSISKEADLAGLAAAEADDAFLQAAAAQIQDQAQAFLIDGMESLSQAKVGSALQVFFNLEQLQQAVDAVLSQHLHELERCFKQSLDSRHLSMSSGAAPGAAAAAAGGAGPGGPGGARGLVLPAPGAAGSWQDKLWQSLRSACDCLANGCLAVWHLQRVVAKKRDPLSHVLFLDELCPPGQPLLTEKYWADALRVIGDAFAAAARPSKGGFVRDALGASYPRLLTLLEGAFARIQSESRLKGVPPAAQPDQLAALLDASGPFRDAYLAACLGRMQDAVAAAFPGSARVLPSPADVQKCIGLLHEELKAAGSSAHLAGLVGSAVGKALRLVAEKAEYMAAAGPELRQVRLKQLNVIAISAVGKALRLVAEKAEYMAAAGPELRQVRLKQLNVIAISAVGKVLRLVAEKAEYMAAAGPELRQVRLKQLNVIAISAVGKALRLVAEKAEYMAAAGPELRQVSLGPGAGGGANAAQVRNIALCSQLQEVHRSLVTLLPRLPAPATAALQTPLEALQATAIDTVSPIFKAAMEVFEAHIMALYMSPIFKAAMEVFEAHIMAMHKQRWGPAAAAAAAATGADGAAEQGRASDSDAGMGGVIETSAYVSELANAIAVFRSEFLAKFIPAPSPNVPSVGSTLAEVAAGRLLMLWVRQACLLRALSQNSKLVLAKDLGEVQLVVGQGLFPLEALGPAHRCLRAFRALLFAEHSSLPGAACLKDLPASLVLHHCFSRLPPSIQSPAELSGMAPQQYSKWLDQHSSADVAARVAAALQAARGEAAAVAAADAGKAAVLAVMRQLCGVE
ncbi:hypothetical protein OEZ85_013963 [Tetradesmus obliquus]|uniref:Conserved oligomeric Golgi complex subunit 5 helical domain-containing protein n=1 Tax=Tetradesmus obliquus TaxID=3088 RepID=A0ABY8U767_TETOB|nr:hypothetical protein OEZ85_013963 [Tetradesmus obliquus]